MCKVAVLFTGAYRTFDRTYNHILENILKPNEATAFVFCESNIPTFSFHELLKSRWGAHVGSVESLQTTRTPDFNAILEYLLKTKPAIAPEVLQKFGYSQEYIKRSGAVLEYYQFMKCYDLMLEYEKTHNVKFDVVIRSRFDLILTQPLYLKRFFETVNTESIMKHGEEVYIRSLGNEDMAAIIENNKIKPMFEYDLYQQMTPTYDDHDTLKKINENKYIWTFYCNWIWVAKRHTMDLIYPFVYFYGNFLSDKRDCFNSENQFYDFLKSKDCEVFYFFTRHDADLWGAHELHKYPTLQADNSLNSEINKSLVISTIIRH